MLNEVELRAFDDDDRGVKPTAGDTARPRRKRALRNVMVEVMFCSVFFEDLRGGVGRGKFNMMDDVSSTP